MQLASVFIAILAGLTTALAFNVSRERISKRIPHGEGPNHELSRAVRAHGNSVEHLVPIGLLLLCAGSLEVDRKAVLVLGTAAVTARVFLSIGILAKGQFTWRRAGAWTTYAIEFSLVGLVLERAFAHWHAA